MQRLTAVLCKFSGPRQITVHATATRTIRQFDVTLDKMIAIRKVTMQTLNTYLKKDWIEL